MIKKIIFIFLATSTLINCNDSSSNSLQTSSVQIPVYYSQEDYEINGGLVHYRMDILTSWQLMGELKVLIDKYEQKEGHFPKTQGKYFIEELKPYMNTSNSNFIAHFLKKLKNSLAYKENCSTDIQNCQEYISINGVSYISYLPPNQFVKNYRLYWIGANNRDDLGGYDDIIFTSP